MIYLHCPFNDRQVNTYYEIKSDSLYIYTYAGSEIFHFLLLKLFDEKINTNDKNHNSRLDNSKVNQENTVLLSDGLYSHLFVNG